MKSLKDFNLILYENAGEQEFDNHGNLIHVKKMFPSFEWWREYDEKGQVTLYRDSKGNIEKYENDNLIYKKNIGGEFHYKYDEQNREIYYRWGDYESWKTYSKGGLEVNFKGSKGLEWCKKYNKDGQKIYYKDNIGNFFELKHNKKRKIIQHFHKSSNNPDWIYTVKYKKNGNTTIYNDGNTTWCVKWDAEKRIEHYYDGVRESFKEYDEDGNKIHVWGMGCYEQWRIKEGWLIKSEHYYLEGKKCVEKK